MIITLPLPPRVLHPNERPPHWAVKHIAAQNYKAMARIVGYGCGARYVEKVQIRPVFYFKTNRRRDGDGLIAWIKAAIDGIKEAGVIEDDSTEHIEWLDPQVGKDAGNPRLELHISPLEQREAA